MLKAPPLKSLGPTFNFGPISSTHLDASPKSEPALELHSRPAPSVEAHHCVRSPKTGRNSRERQIKNNNKGLRK